MVKKFVNVILAFIIVYSFINIFFIFSDYKESTKLYNELQLNTTDINENLLVFNKLNHLESINNDFYGYIVIDDTNINYPIVQTYDNEFYLNHNFEKKESSSGCVFIDYKYNELSNNMPIYGHNMKNKTMFNNILGYKKEELDSPIEIYTKDYYYKYEVFSTYTTIGSDAIGTYNYLSDTQLNSLEERSIVKYNTTVSENDKIITLVTCSYEFKDARTVVHGKLIEKTPISQL